jgi:hypothetical protein
MRCCPVCKSAETEHRVHVAAMDEYHEIFYREYLEARAEYVRLCTLFKDAAWYNFETVCRSWNQPWAPTHDDSGLTLMGVRVEIIRKRGHAREKVTFPTYYSGTLRDAPRLPPQIIMAEMDAARDYMHECQKRTDAPYDWAPGGDEYQRLVREGESARVYEARRISNTHSETAQDDGRREAQARECGLGLRLGDPMERASETYAQTTTEDLL